MFDFLKQVSGGEHHMDAGVLAGRLAAAFLLGLLSALIHSLTCVRNGRGPDRPFLATLVLLPVLIALVTTVIGDNAARAFSLVGTLAIVRFRTVVEDTRDTAFVIYSVAAGMCAAGGYLIAPIIAAPLILAGAWFFRSRGLAPAATEGRLILRLAVGRQTDSSVAALLAEHLPAHRLTGLSTARGGAALDATYTITLPPPEQVFALVAALGKVEGVQNVEIKDD